MTQKHAISIIVPTLNEAANIETLANRIDKSISTIGVDYEVIIIDDHSKDDTVKCALSLADRFPIRVSLKKGKRGKAYSLLQGFAEARHPLIVMIDADLQYPPEAIPAMYKLLRKHDADVIITERKTAKTSPLRRLSSNVFNFVFARMLFGITFDTQSGLKLFKKNILSSMQLTPSPWSFDLEFIVRSLENNFRILSHTIPFAERIAGETKVHLLSTTMELAQASLKLRWNSSRRKTRAGKRQNIKYIQETALFIAAVVFLLPIGQSILSQKASADPLGDSSSLISLVSDTVNTTLTTTYTILNPQPTAIIPSTPIQTSDDSPSMNERNATITPAVALPISSQAASRPITIASAPAKIQPSVQEAVAQNPKGTPQLASVTKAGASKPYQAPSKISGTQKHLLTLGIASLLFAGFLATASFIHSSKRNRKLTAQQRMSRYSS